MPDRDEVEPSAPPVRRGIPLALVVALLGVVIALPLLIGGFPPRAHDANTHELWTGAFARQLYAGELYPRWLAEMNDGLGSPAFFYYPPLPTYVAALLGLLLPGTEPLRDLGLGAAAAIVASGLAAFAWLRRITTPRAAAIAAILYMGMPYHYKVDVFTRGAYAELWAFVWMPLCLRFARERPAGHPSEVPWLALAYALLALTHLPTSLLFSPVLVAHAVMLAEPGTRARRMRRVATAMALGVGLAAIYLVPAMTTQGWVRIERSLDPPSDVASNAFFRASGEPFRDDFTRTLCQLAFGMIGVALLSFLLVRRYGGDVRSAERRAARFWIAVALVAFGMMFSVAGFVFDAIPPLRSIQFPWRFHVVLCVAAAALVAVAISTIRRPFSPRKVVCAVTGALLLGISIPTTLGAVRAKQRPPRGVEASRRVERMLHRWCVPEYRPVRGADDVRVVPGVFRRADGTLDRVRVVEGRADVSIVSWAPREIRFAVEAAAGATVEVAQLSYPGWTATSSDGVDLAVEPAAGVVRLGVPDGSRTIDLRLAAMPAERWGAYVSVASVVALLGLLLRSRGRRSTRAVGRAPARAFAAARTSVVP